MDVPPIRSSGAESDKPGDMEMKPEMYVADGDFIQDIEVNDLRNRYLLTKGSTQEMVNGPQSICSAGFGGTTTQVIMLS